jgi:hypothetical protein
MAEELRKSGAASRTRNTSVGENAVTSVLSANEVPVFDRELNADEAALAALGYKYDCQVAIMVVQDADIEPDPSLNVNFLYGRPFASLLPSWVFFHRLRRLCGLAWAMLEPRVWSGVGSSPSSSFNVSPWGWVCLIFL